MVFRNKFRLLTPKAWRVSSEADLTMGRGSGDIAGWSPRGLRGPPIMWKEMGPFGEREVGERNKKGRNKKRRRCERWGWKE